MRDVRRYKGEKVRTVTAILIYILLLSLFNHFLILNGISFAFKVSLELFDFFNLYIYFCLLVALCWQVIYKMCFINKKKFFFNFTRWDINNKMYVFFRIIKTFGLKVNKKAQTFLNRLKKSFFVAFLWDVTLMQRLGLKEDFRFSY